MEAWAVSSRWLVLPAAASFRWPQGPQARLSRHLVVRRHSQCLRERRLLGWLWLPGTGVATGAALATDGGVTALEAASGGASQGSGIIEAVTSGCPGCFVAGTLIALLGADAEAIENIRVGDRVQTTQSSSVTAVDSSWRLVELEGVSSGELEESLHVRLLRSPASLEAHGVSGSGDHVYLKLKELGFEGWLRVVGIQDAPEISSGPGRVVLSTFTRLSNDVYEVGFVGGAVLRGTGGHPLWSLDRDDWVSVRDLQVGERLQTAEGAVSVEALEKVRGLHRVYNLEVEGTTSTSSVRRGSGRITSRLVGLI